MITVIVPHARPQYASNLLANFRRQRGIEAQLLVVENGDAVGSVSSEDATVICSGNHQSDAMNTGLAWLRANGGGAWARFDDDDWYGPGYLASVEVSLQGSGLIVSGMPWRFVMLDDGLHQFQGTGEFTGGSLAASNADVLPFERCRDDDIRWSRNMRAQGHRFVQRSPQGYCYDRTTRAAPRVIAGGAAVTRFGFGSSLYYGQQEISAVDNPGLSPQRAMPEPSNEELLRELVNT